jgi:hypothetical protein
LLLSTDGKSAVGVHEARRSVALATRSPLLKSRVVPYSDIIECVVVEDGVVVTSASRSSQIAGGIAGGVLFGPVGAVVGAVTGKRVAADRVTALELHLTINDTAEPRHVLRLVCADTAKAGILYRTMRDRARTWHARFSAVIRQADDETRRHRVVAAPNGSPFSVADELSKLADLRARGVLTQAQYDAQQARLLGE